MDLSNCPICGAKAIITRDAPDGFFMGYSVGCPRYTLNDGIHTKRMCFFGINTKENAIKKWNKYAKENEVNG